jgi:thioredoxin reductase (NADPH)
MNGQARPVLFLVGHDPGELGALRRALDRRFGTDYRILTERVPERGLSVLAALREHDEPVAVLVADLAMPGMAGEAFLQRAHDVHPFARRALMAPVFDRPAEQAVFHAMALGRVDMILVRPWDPAEHWLYPRIGMLLDDWVQATEQPGVSAMRIVAEPGAPRTHELRDLLYRNAVPVQSFPPDSPEGRHLLELAGQDGQQVPVCV